MTSVTTYGSAVLNSEGGVLQGEDVGELQQESLRRHLAVVPQDTVLLNDTILENIRYGDLTASDEEVCPFLLTRSFAKHIQRFQYALHSFCTVVWAGKLLVCMGICVA